MNLPGWAADTSLAPNIPPPPSPHTPTPSTQHNTRTLDIARTHNLRRPFLNELLAVVSGDPYPTNCLGQCFGLAAGCLSPEHPTHRPPKCHPCAQISRLVQLAFQLTRQFCHRRIGKICTPRRRAETTSPFDNFRANRTQRRNDVCALTYCPTADWGQCGLDAQFTLDGTVPLRHCRRSVRTGIAIATPAIGLHLCSQDNNTTVVDLSGGLGNG